MNKILLLSCLFLVLISATTGSKAQDLYPIRQGVLWGYIDLSGKVVIKPHFLSAGSFSDGLAPVRSGAYYGYINSSGAFVIPPAYDLALPFKDGIAKVFVGSKPNYIDTHAALLFRHNYLRVSAGGKDSFSVMTQTGKAGIVNRQGKLLVDTAYGTIEPFREGLAVVTSPNYKLYGDDEKAGYEIGVINNAGNWVVPYGLYREINDFHEGFSVVKLKGNDEDDKAVIDRTGKLRFRFPDNWYMVTPELFFDGSAIVHIRFPEQAGKGYAYYGVIDTNGQLRYADTNWRELTPLIHNRTFALDRRSMWHLLDSKGNQVIPQGFDEIAYQAYGRNRNYPFENGIAFVQTDQGWGAIDTNGRYVAGPRMFDEDDYDHARQKDKMLIFDNETRVEHLGYVSVYGFWDTEKDIYLKPQYRYVEPDAETGMLRYAVRDERSVYLDERGKEVWLGDTLPASLGRLNIDFMNRGYFYASAKYRDSSKGYSSWNQSGSPLVCKPGKLRLIWDTLQRIKWAEGFDGAKLFVINATTDMLYFNAQDRRLYMKVQAKDKEGDWKDIEYLPSSWCGNSYHSLSLVPGECWQFPSPLYEGGFKTKLRVALRYKKKEPDRDDETGKRAGADDIVYSNEIDGSINPGQFWNKRMYYPNGVMDAYND